MSEQDKRWSFGALPPVSVLVALLAMPCLAEANNSGVETDADADAMHAVGTHVEGESESAAEVSAQDSGEATTTGFLSKLQVHGFLTQAWADAKFQDVEVGLRPPPPFGPGGVGPLGASPNGTEISLGIPEDGTTNYRFLALQFRYAVSSKDIFVVQFASRTLGFSPLQDFEDEVQLDWAFYERRISDQTRLKVGRVQIPFGIYNELRDVGTVLPFYRPAFVHYKEAAFTSETVDGLSLSHKFFAQSDWNLDVTVYAGEWKTTLLFPPNPDLSQVDRVPNGYGYQVWLNTPLSDLRIGTGLVSGKPDKDSTFPLRAVERSNIFHGSLDVPIGRFTLQAEWDTQDVDVSFSGLPISTKNTNWYVLAGVKATEKFRIWGQWESADFTQDSVAFAHSVSYNGRTDVGVALNYVFSPNLVLKAEYHTVKGENFNLFPVPPGLLQPVIFHQDDGSYTILALSASF